MITIDSRELESGLKRFEALSQEMAADAVSATLAEAEKEAKNNAPWTDRTGNARASIYGTEAQQAGSEYKGFLGIGVFYGVFLELCHEGRFAIVWNTLEQAAQRLPIWIKWSYERHI